MAKIKELLLAEHGELHSDLRSYYEYQNKLDSGFVLFSTTVLTIGFGLFSFSENMYSKYVEFYEKIGTIANDTFYQNQYYSMSITLLALQFFQALFFFTPILYSKICFNHTLENYVRISMIKDYLLKLDIENENDHNLFTEQNKYYKRIRSDQQKTPKDSELYRPKKSELYPEHFNSFGAIPKLSRVGNVKTMHVIISSLSLLLGMTNGVLVYRNCVFMDSTYNSYEERLVKTLSILLTILVCAAVITHIVIVIVAYNRVKKDTGYNGKGSRITNIISMWIYFLGVAITCFVLVMAGYQCKGLSNPIVPSRFVLSSLFTIFVIFCIFQFPGYTVESMAAKKKIDHNTDVFFPDENSNVNSADASVHGNISSSAHSEAHTDVSESVKSDL